MKRSLFILSIFAIGFATSCKSDKKDSAPADEPTEINEPSGNEQVTSNEPKVLTITLEAKSGSNATGTAVFTEMNGKVKMVAELTGLKEGKHAIHLHEKSDCSASDGTSTGGHWNPTNQPHGQWGSPEGYHKGDIGNMNADANGNAIITIETNEWCIGCGDPNKDILGKAVIVHEGVDDFVTQPTGNAGGRVSCGGIIE
ncbi:MAG TPA: superoxide dismutase family protein [Aquaticitalea sp.]|nr:superoxide dismutase family protein [Aquaticitalea sp.]